MNPAVEAVSVFFPCYNDEATIARMVELVVATIGRIGVDDAEVIVVNDGSTDGSAAILDDLVDARAAAAGGHARANRGYGGALLSGFAASTKQWVFYTDGDGQFDPAELELLVQRASTDVDVVQGYKLRRADGMLRRGDRPGVPPVREAHVRVAHPRHRLRLPPHPSRARSIA